MTTERTHDVTHLERLDAEVDAQVEAWCGTKAQRQAALDRLSEAWLGEPDADRPFAELDTAGAAYIAAELCNRLPMRDREELCAALRERCLP